MKNLDIIIIPTGPSFEADKERSERALQENLKYFMISGIQNGGVEIDKVDTYDKSQRFQIYKTLKNKGVQPKNILVSNGYNS